MHFDAVYTAQRARIIFINSEVAKIDRLNYALLVYQIPQHRDSSSIARARVRDLLGHVRGYIINMRLYTSGNASAQLLDSVNSENV